MMRTIGFMLLAGTIGFSAGCGRAAPKPTREKATASENKTLPSAQNSTAGMSDKERLQGVWVVDSIEFGHPKSAPPQEDIKALRFQVLGDRFLVTKGDTVLMLHTFILDTSKSPKWMTVPVFNAKGEPTVSITTGADGKTIAKPVTRNLIYKFDGDDLVFAEAPQGGSNFRPSELKASPAVSPKLTTDPAATVDTFRPAVDVYHLKKTNEPPIAEALIPKIHDAKK